VSAQGLITDCLEKLRSKGRKGLIAYITAGDLNLAATVEIARQMFANGADVIELGIPFSDPLADGPVIQQASCRALAAGVDLSGILHAVENIRRDCPQPIILMGYYNPLYQYGIRQFAGDAAAAGVNGLIVPDLPFEESAPLREAALEAGLDLIPLVAPTTTDGRLHKITKAATGFIYCVSVAGVTGARAEIKTDLAAFTARVRCHTNLPLAVGFGIAGPEQAARAAVHCDAVVIGSAIVKAIAESGMVSPAVCAAGLVERLRFALDTI